MTVVDPSLSTAAAAIPSLPAAKDIPVTFSDSVKHWWASGEKQSAIAEERLLRRLPYFRPAGSAPHTPDESGLVASSSSVTLDSPKRYLNTFTIKSTTPSPDAPSPVVILHGYGAGLGFFFQNFPAIGQWVAQRHSAMYAVDWMGMGRSARVPFTVTAPRTDVNGRVTQSESFFIEALEEWREKQGIERMQLVGHSLGGYLSAAYALRFPNRVSKLILVSPAGIPHDPNGSEIPSREVVESQEESIRGPPGSPGSNVPGRMAAQEATKSKVESIKKEQVVEKKQESRQRQLFTYLWEQGWSPFQVVRSAGVWAPMLIGKYSSRRFSTLSEEETRDMHDYIQQITLAKGSGEYCISHILAPGAHARKPIVDRIAALKIPVTFIYGDHDWMDPQGGYKSVENLRNAGNPNGKMFIVPRAGHHVYLDNVKATNDLIVKELDSSP